MLSLDASGCARDTAPPSSSGPGAGGARGANVLLVTIDTLRRDRVGAYGSTLGLTSTIDRLAATGVRYARAYAHAPMTLPAHASILTGRTPVGHGLRNNGAFQLDAAVPTMATALKAAGYRTGAFVGAFVLDARYGLARGFDVYDDRMPGGRRATSFRIAERRGDDVVGAATAWIQQTGAATPWFAWVHLYDPHAPYDAPSPSSTGRTAYDGEVAYADAMVGRLLEGVAAAGASNRTLVIATADHGESLGEHGESTHGLFAYDATLAVPLVIAGPGVGPREVTSVVGHADLLPTVLDMVGVPVPSGVTGMSLTQDPNASREVYFEALDASLTHGWAPLTGVVTAGWKFIDLPERELYDLAHDPLEASNVAPAETATADALDRRRRALLSTPAASAPSARRDVEGDRRLRALGYVAGATGGSNASRASHLDPKHLVAVHERFTTALDLFSAGKADDALKVFQGILRERPEFIAARTSAATVLIEGRRPAEAVALLDAAPPGDRDVPELLAKLGVARREAGDLDGARVALEAARTSGWQNPEALNDLGVVYARLGRIADARAALSALTASSPGAADAWNNLGVLELGVGRLVEAAAAFRRAVDADPTLGDAWQGLGAALVERDRAGAIDAWRRAEPLLPHDFDLLYNLGMLLATTDQPAAARPYLTRFVERAPMPRYRDDKARAAAVLKEIAR